MVSVDGSYYAFGIEDEKDQRQDQRDHVNGFVG